MPMSALQRERLARPARVSPPRVVRAGGEGRDVRVEHLVDGEPLGAPEPPGAELLVAPVLDATVAALEREDLVMPEATETLPGLAVVPILIRSSKRM